MIADVGTEDAMQEQGAQSLRLPPFLARAETIEEINEMQNDGEQWEYMDPADRLKLRPDIMMVDISNSQADALLNSTNSVKRSRSGKETVMLRQQKFNVKIIEIGYCSDTRYHDKIKEKQAQHARLCTILRREGHSVEFLPIILGTYGSIFNTLNKALDAVKVPRREQDRLARKLVDLACQSHSNILKQRRYLENHKKPPDK